MIFTKARSDKNNDTWKGEEMKGLKQRVVIVVFAVVICMMSTCVTFASDSENEDAGFWSSVGGWFIDRGSDIGNAATITMDATGQWFVDRGEDICEVSAIIGNWTCDRTNEVAVFVTNSGEAIVCAASNFDPSVLSTKEYYLNSGEKLLLGDYSDNDPTALSIGLNLAASVANVDLGMDIRDLAYDIQYYGSEDVKLSGLALDAVAVLPVIGVVKYLKYADVIDDVADTAKLADDMTDAAKAADLIDDVVDTGKDIVKIPVDELPEMVQETYKMYSNCAWDGEKALEDMTEGTQAGRIFKNTEEELPLIDKMGNKLSYREYDAYQKGFDPNPLQDGQRGPCRFVRDNNGNVYYSDDHYDTFKRIV